jgi:hypothetical protein
MSCTSTFPVPMYATPRFSAISGLLLASEAVT